MVCHHAVRPSASAAAAGLAGRSLRPACRTLAIQACRTLAIHNRDPSRPGCLAADDASELQLERPILILYSPFTCPAVAGDSPRSARSTVETQFSETVSESDRPDANAVVECGCQVTTACLVTTAFSGARPCPFSRSGAASQAASAPSPASQPLASAERAAARPLLAHVEAGLRSIPGALCVTTVTTGSHPEPLVLVFLSSPDLVASACVPKLFWSLNDG